MDNSISESATKNIKMDKSVSESDATNKNIKMENSVPDCDVSVEVLKFSKDLLEKMILRCQNLEKLNVGKQKKIQDLKAAKIELIEKVYARTDAQNAHGKISNMVDQNLIFAEILNAGRRNIGACMLHYMSVSSQLKAYKEKNEPKHDKFTLMSYHDMEQEINRINIEINELLKSANQAFQDSKALSSKMEMEIKEVQHEINKLKIYLREQRAELKHLKERKNTENY